MQLHTWEDAWLQDERGIGKLTELKSQGLIHAIGLSLNRWEPWNGVKAVESGLIDAVQVIYNIFDQNPRDELFPACRQHGVAVIARVPFDEGTLTGQLTKDSRWPRRLAKYLLCAGEPGGQRGSRRPAEAAGQRRHDDARMALRFILAEPTVSTIIPGMRKVRHVEANLAASDAGRWMKTCWPNWRTTAGIANQPNGRSEARGRVSSRHATGLGETGPRGTEPFPSSARLIRP